jgi:transcriptional regulator with XRE-family HTH domain
MQHFAVMVRPDEFGRHKAEFGRHLRKLLRLRDMPQKDLASRLGKGPGKGTSMVNSWVNGRNLPTIKTFIRIAAILRLSRREIVALVVDVFDLRRK